jgi:hypothetical protein
MKKLLFLFAASAIVLVACSKDKSDDLIEPMTKSGEVFLTEGLQAYACTYYVWTVRVGVAGVPYYSYDGYSGKLCGSGFTGCSYTAACSALKK